MPKTWQGQWLAGAIGCVMLCTPPEATAERDMGSLTTEPLEDALGIEEDADLPTWDLRIGGLVAVGPDYEGATDYQVARVPYLRLSWKDRVSFRGRSIEANLISVDGLRAGPLLLTRGGRDEDENHALHGLGDVDRSFEAGVFVRWRTAPFGLRGAVLQDVSDAHDGLLARVGGGVQIPFAKPWLVLQADAEWASDHYMQTVFGIDAVQSMRSGMRAHRARSGFKHVGVTAVSRLALDAHWSAVVSVGYRRLLGDAADSPIVDDRGDENSVIASLGFVYRF